ncbi:MAG: hypothetical protein ACTHOK_12910, partial [Nocardioidaceae bacterium]
MSNPKHDAQPSSDRDNAGPGATQPHRTPGDAGSQEARLPASLGQALQRPARDLPPALGPLPAGVAAVAEAFSHSWALLEAYLQAPAADGSRGNAKATVGTEVIAVRKHLFWLVTGRLPERGRQRHFNFHADHAVPGWTPLVPEDVEDLTIVDYLDALSATVAPTTRNREHGQVSKFYRWLTGSEDHPAQGARALLDNPPAEPVTSRQDGFYTAAESACLLRASRDLLTAARALNTGTKADRKEWLGAEVDHVLAWLLWGTGVDAAAILALAVTDLDLEAATITWGPTSRAEDSTDEQTASPSGGEAGDDVELVQSIPSALVAALEDYLTRVRPHLGIRGDRLLANPRAPGGGAVYRLRVAQDLTHRLAEATGLDKLPGRHTPSRWCLTYSHRIMEAPRGSMITLMWLHGRRSWT